MEILPSDQFYRLKAALAPLAAGVIEQLEDQHYILGSDEGLNWCQGCASAEAARLRADDPTGHYQVGCSIDQDSDQLPPCCEGCGKQLASDLTEYSLGEALDSLRLKHLLPRKTRDWSALRCLQILEAIAAYDLADEPEQASSARHFVNRLERAVSRLSAAPVSTQH